MSAISPIRIVLTRTLDGRSRLLARTIHERGTEVYTQNMRLWLSLLHGTGTADAVQ